MSIFSSLKRIFIGQGRDPHDSKAFHNLTLVAFFAWVGLGSDGMSSSSYGPSEVMMALGQHSHLGFIIAIATVITIFIISTSYTQIIELFPSGGGGYLVASKLLSPNLGMISGSALLIDYVLTISVSIASGTEALFSFLPLSYQPYRIEFALFIVILLIVMNLRGVKESVMPLVPIFLVFVLTHVFVILYGVITHSFNMPEVAAKTSSDFHATYQQLGFFGMLFVLVHAYSMGAGTYTGIEAVSNGLPILREPRVHTARKTMLYMSFSLSFMVLGLLICYLLYNAQFVPGKTLNASLFVLITGGWNPALANIFVVITLISEAAILYVAAQTGFIDGPRVLSSMALDRWMPTKFASLSDRLVTQNGVILMGAAAFILILATQGNVSYMIVLYSINVFLTFSLSQIGMVRHWWQERNNDKKWLKKILINGVGGTLTVLILISVILVKFNEGGWITIFITGSLVAIAFAIKKHYTKTGQTIKALDDQLLIFDTPGIQLLPKNKQENIAYNKNSKTAVLLVNGFSGIGMHSLLSIFRLFGETFQNFVFVEIGMIDAGVFKGAADIDKLEERIKGDVDSYIKLMNSLGYYAEGFTATGLDIVQETLKLTPQITERFPQSVFFGGQIVFKNDTFFTRLLHNYTVFAVQKELYHRGKQFVILPIKL